MQVVEDWYCSECLDGPYWHWQTRCQECGHKRCKGCMVEKDRQQAPNISLHTAVRWNNGALVQKLLDSGADVNIRDSNSDTPLHIATFLGNSDMIRVLLEKGANGNARNSDSDTPLHIATISRNLDIVRVLLENGADVNLTNSIIGTPLHIAVWKEQFELIRLLLENSVNVNVKNLQSQTPLHIAIIRQNLDMIRVLLEKGADVNLTNSDFDTPLHIAIAHTNFDIITTLLQAGANVNMPRGSGETALTMTLQRKLHDVVEVLLEAGALLNKAIQDVVSKYHGSEWSQVEVEVKWDVPQFVRSELSGKVDDLRKVVTLTGSVKNAQMMSVEEYVAQTWEHNGVRVLDALIEMMQTGYAELDMSAGKTATFKIDGRGLLRIALKTSQEQTVDIME